ncbi:MAG: hypothetical protein CVT47_02265 [Thermoplasmata archaeon HGW-Thermoplasmata-2]|nr:MAG: hypothetical protein CVT47_02265 [Thermoplasmata archaeon HGW-Thermoplasmata-2]
MRKSILSLALCAAFVAILSLCQNVSAQMMGGPADWLGTFFLFLVLILGVLFVVVWILIMVWVYRDAEKRGMEGVLWLIVVLVAHLVGLIIYLIIRGSHPVKAAPRAQPAQPAAQEVQAFQPVVQKTAQTKRIECPSCGTIFPVEKNPSDPTPVKCPNCGKEGTIP